MCQIHFVVVFFTRTCKISMIPVVPQIINCCWKLKSINSGNKRPNVSSASCWQKSGDKNLYENHLCVNTEQPGGFVFFLLFFLLSVLSLFYTLALRAWSQCHFRLGSRLRHRVLFSVGHSQCFVTGWVLNQILNASSVFWISYAWIESAGRYH